MGLVWQSHTKQMRNEKKMKKIRLPLLAKIIIAIFVGVLVGQFAPEFVIRSMNTFCALFDQLLRFMIPLIIVGLVTPAIAEVGDRAGRLLVLTVALAYFFTVCSGLFAYGFSTTLFPHLIDTEHIDKLQRESQVFAPYFTVQIPPLMEVMSALVLSFMMGLGIAVVKSPTLDKGFGEVQAIVVKVIEKVIIPLLPFYIFGLFLDMTSTGKVAPVLEAFIAIVLVIFVMTLVLLLLQFCVAGLVAKKNPLRLLGHMVPAYFTALGTSSSAATIPVTLKCTTKNGVNPSVAGFTVPLCATIHLSGSTLKITSCAIALMLLIGKEVEFGNLFGFILMLGVTMIAAPGVPGGAIMAALGVLNSMLGFDSQQQAMMITLYIAMDSFGTACNVTGDGAIALLIDKINDGRGFQKSE